MRTLSELILDAERELEEQILFVREITELSPEQELKSLQKIRSTQTMRDNGLRPSDRVNTEKGAYLTALNLRISRLERQLSK